MCIRDSLDGLKVVTAGCAADPGAAPVVGLRAFAHSVVACLLYTSPSETVWKNIIYQQQRGEIALGSGGIFGNGLFGGRYYSVPNAHNDFSYYLGKRYCTF